MTPPAALVAYWRAAGAVPDSEPWVALAGGRSNALWRVGDRVCKLFRPEGDTPLFANDAGAEARALEALAGTGLAPRLVAFGESPAGPSLIYIHVAGRPWVVGDDPAPVARALARLHALALSDGFPPAPMGAAALIAQAAAMGAEGRPPDLPDLPSASRVFLHGDATAGNALVKADGVTFIDWQCPALGDATEDLATFLSPAMQHLSGNAPLSPEAESAFLEAYGDPKTVARYRALAPAYHWRMAAYCDWRAARGEAAYIQAAALERARLR